MDVLSLGMVYTAVSGDRKATVTGKVYYSHGIFRSYHQRVIRGTIVYHDHIQVGIGLAKDIVQAIP
jgi:hypothetical protein